MPEVPRHPAGPGGACTGTHSSPTATRPLLGSAGRRWPLLLQRDSARPTWRSPHSSVEARGPLGHVGAPRRGCRPGSRRLRCSGASAGEAPSQPPVTRPFRTPSVSRDRSTHVPGHVGARRSEGTQNTEPRHHVHSTHDTCHAPRGDGADEVQSAPSAGTLGQQSTAPPTTAQHLAGGLNGLRSEAAGTSAPGPCPPRTERSPPPAPAEPRGLPATWGQLAGEAATRLLRPRVLRTAAPRNAHLDRQRDPGFRKRGGAARRSPP